MTDLIGKIVAIICVLAIWMAFIARIAREEAADEFRRRGF